MKTKILIKIQKWSLNHPKLRMFLWYLFSPIALPYFLISKWFIKYIIYKRLDYAIKEKNDHKILRICSIYIKLLIEFNKWKAKISKKWFYNAIQRQVKKIYDYAIKDKSKMDLNYFKNLIGLYCTYNMIGGGIMSKTGDTTIKIDNNYEKI